MRIITGCTVALLSALLIVPAMADQSGGTLDKGSTDMGTGSSRLDRNSAPNLRLGAGTTGMYHGTSGSNLPRWAGQTPDTSPHSSNGNSQGSTNGKSKHPG